MNELSLFTGTGGGLLRRQQDDISAVVQFDYNRWGSDAHSASWLSPKEICDLQTWLETEMGIDNAWKVEIEHWGYLFGNSWGGFHKYPKDRMRGLEDVRFVFWFDN